MRAISAFREGLRAIVEEIGGVPAVWEQQPRPASPMTGDDAGALLLLEFGHPVRVGWDDIVRHDVEGLAVEASASFGTLTATDHGFANGDRIHFFGDDLPGGVDATTLYYVVIATANTFKVSETDGGVSVDLTTAGTDVRVLVAGEDLENEYRGHRRVVLTVKAECTEQGNGRTWHEYLERVRDRLAWRSTVAALELLDAGLVRTEDAVDISETRDGRRISIGALDVHLAFGTTERDTAHRYSTIQTVQLLGTVNGDAQPPLEIGA